VIGVKIINEYQIMFKVEFIEREKEMESEYIWPKSAIDKSRIVK